MTQSYPKPIGELLLRLGAVTEEQLKTALDIQQLRGGKLGTILVSLGYIAEDLLMAFLGKQYGLPFVSLSEYGNVTDEVINLVPASIARRHMLMPISKNNHELTVAISDPLNVFVLDEIKLLTGCDIKAVIAPETEIRDVLHKCYSKRPTSILYKKLFREQSDPLEQGVKNSEETALKDKSPKGRALKDESATASPPKRFASSPKGRECFASSASPPVLKHESASPPAAGSSLKFDMRVANMVNTMINEAIQSRATHLHIEPVAGATRIRFRIDGVLHEGPEIPKKLHIPLLSQIKTLAELKALDKHYPQSGKMRLSSGNRVYDIYVSTAITPSGEKAVLKLPNPANKIIDLSHMGFELETITALKRCINKNSGLILITGHARSGKTTTLYSVLSVLNHPERSIVTIEKAPEYLIAGINQLESNKTGNDYSEIFQTALEQDPDTIVVGELVDGKTAGMALSAGRNGYIVFSTMAASDSVNAIMRLCDMGLDTSLVASSLTMVVTQILVRKPCPDCKISYNVTLQDIMSAGLSLEKVKAKDTGAIILYRANGCDNCYGTGYRGQTGCFEVLEIDNELRQLIAERAPAAKIKQLAVARGMLVLKEAVLRKVLVGTTTVEEMLRSNIMDD